MKKFEQIEPKIIYNDNLTLASVTYKGKNYFGTATIHPEDKDFESKNFGARLAHERAILSYYKTQRKFYKDRYFKLSHAIFKMNFTSEQIKAEHYDKLKMYFKQFLVWQEKEQNQHKKIAAIINDQENFLQKLKKMRAK